jgi:NAD(P)-dependent dehydrogenase (short-subunit alcohol dehydrogenase family)
MPTAAGLVAERFMAGSEPRQHDAAAAVPRNVLVAGASGGIGAAFCETVAAQFPAARLLRLARDPASLPPLACDTLDIAFDIGEEQRIAVAVSTIPDAIAIDWVFVATGWLHDDRHTPEKTYRNLDADHLLHAYRINAVGPLLLLKHLIPRLCRDRAARIGVLSARVGSISDNRLGGWHAYRASKAALNMLIRNLAIELARRQPQHLVVGLQPGTTATALSAPFQRNVPAGQLQTPKFTAVRLLEVMQGLTADDSGGLLDFLGIPFAP